MALFCMFVSSLNTLHTNQRLNASKKRNRLTVLFRDIQIISARADISAWVEYKYSSD